MIIPIGTKSSLALKPKVTIGLIIANVIVAIISFPLMKESEKDLFKVYRHLYANQIRLYVAEHRPNERFDPYFQGHFESSLKQIETAEDYIDLEIGIMEALSFVNATIEDIESYGEELLERTELFYADLHDGSDEIFDDWKRLKSKEEKILQANVVYALGLTPKKMSHIHTFFTHLFLHGGIMHLLGNMLFLWIVGCLLEDSWGRMAFLGFYLLGGAFAGLAHCLQDTTSATPLVGASGAIAAAMGAFTIRHFWTKIKFFYFFIFFFRPLWGTFYLPACIFLPFWFFQQVTLKYLSDFMGGSDVAYLAHIAGYVAGVVTALAVRMTGAEERYLAPIVQRKQVEAGVLMDPRFDKACKLMDQGEIEKAKYLFNQLIKASPDHLNMMQDIAIIYKEHGLIRDYDLIVNKVLQKLLLKSMYEEASVLALDIINRREPLNTNPQYLMRVAKWLTDESRYGEAHDIYRSIIRNNSSPQVSAKASIALAKLLTGKMNNLRDALIVLEEARDLSLDAEWSERILELEDTLKEMVPAGKI